MPDGTYAETDKHRPPLDSQQFLMEQAEMNGIKNPPHTDKAADRFSLLSALMRLWRKKVEIGLMRRTHQRAVLRFKSKYRVLAGKVFLSPALSSFFNMV